MRRRAVLAAAASALVGAPRARGQGTRLLRFIPDADPGALDPVADPRPVVAAAALLVCDTLYGVNARLEPQPQMCESHVASDDLCAWTFLLRPDLRFHDGAPVTAHDAVASLNRWMARDRMGQAIRDRLDALEVADARTFRFRLRSAFAPMLYALGKCNPPLAVVLPERLAHASPTQPVAELIGSGPMRLRAAEGGGRAVFERVADYAARAEGADWLAGGKRVLFERIEWNVVPDPAAAAEALQNGDADWWEAPDPDMVPLLKRNRNVIVDIVDPLGGLGALRLNHRAPPFDDVRVRRILLASLSQEACMRALTGGDDALWKPMPGVFTPGTPVAAQVAAAISGDPPAAPQDLDAARRALADLGVAGARAIVLAVDRVAERAQAGAVAALLQRLGFTPELQPLAASALAARLAQPEAWHCFATWHDGAEMATPAAAPLDAGGEGVGWPRSGTVQDAIAAWYAAGTPADAAAAALAVTRATLANVSYIPTGFFQRYQAWRTSLSGIARAPLPLFWGVQKT
jgi:peptide/nickel transport system substrate-binding protein